MQPFSDRFLLTVHGVTSDNSGLAKLRAHCEEALPGLACDSFFYGNVGPFRDLTEATADFTGGVKHGNCAEVATETPRAQLRRHHRRLTTISRHRPRRHLQRRHRL